MGSCVGIEGLNLESICPGVTDTRRIEEVLLSKSQGQIEGIYGELWHACAGPMVNLPRVGEKAFYFPQGHLEQVEAFTKNEISPQIPIPAYNLPSKILCKVVYVQLKAELDTDEVFAQVTLLPDTKPEDPAVMRKKLQAPRKKAKVNSFSKTLTPSDTSTHGGFSVHRKHANECLPPLDLTQNPPSQELVAKDLHGVEWRFRHIYRGQPKRHLLTTGWSTFVSSKRLLPGDTFIFMRGENGEFRVGIRRALKSQINISASLITSHSMQLGILATASHSLSTGSMFSVYYRPRTTPASFIVSYDQYMNAARTHIAAGMRFGMKFEGEEGRGERAVGTILGCEDVDSVRWPKSQWKCLVVKWDEPYTASHSTRVSPWAIEPLGDNDVSLGLSRGKRTRTTRSVLSLSSVTPAPPVVLPQLPPPTLRQGHSGVLQGQEINNTTGAQNLRTAQQQSSAHWFPGTSSNMFENPLMNKPFSVDSGNILPSPGAFGNKFGLDGYLFPSFQAYLNADDHTINKWSFPYISSNNTGFQEDTAAEPNEAVAPINQKKEDGAFMLFGVNLVQKPYEPARAGIVLPSALPSQLPSQSDVTESDRLSNRSKTKNRSYSSGSGAASEKQCKNCYNTIRSCTKVQKFGNVLGRSVDLMKFNSYYELVRELDQMFDFGGGLMDPSNGWNVIYTDDEGDMMLLGDYPWLEFRSAVRKLFIWPKNQVEKLNQNLPNPTP